VPQHPTAQAVPFFSEKRGLSPFSVGVFIYTAPSSRRCCVGCMETKESIKCGRSNAHWTPRGNWRPASSSGRP